MSTDSTEEAEDWTTVATFEHDGKTYELDDLRDGFYAIYLGKRQVGDFAVLGEQPVSLASFAPTTEPLIVAAHAAIPPAEVSP